MANGETYISQLNDFEGVLDESYVAVDDGAETCKLNANAVGITTAITQAEATAGTSTSKRVVTPAIFKSAVVAIASAITDVFVSISNPKYTLNTSASSGDDYNLYQAIVALGWESDVIE